MFPFVPQQLDDTGALHRAEVAHLVNHAMQQALQQLQLGGFAQHFQAVAPGDEFDVRVGVFQQVEGLVVDPEKIRRIEVVQQNVAFVGCLNQMVESLGGSVVKIAACHLQRLRQRGSFVHMYFGTIYRADSCRKCL